MFGLKQNSERTYEINEYVSKNEFIGATPTSSVLPKYEEVKHLLPRPIFDGHDDYLACYDFAWKVAFSNLFNPKKDSGFICDFIDTAFNGCLFMWDSSFILMFTKYANRVFPFQKTLDNFYAFQHRDGFISRQIHEETGQDCFARHDPVSTGPNVMPWCEWQYFENNGDKERLRKVYTPLRAYHIWMRKNRTWRDGTYFSSGWGCGMDNIPRLKSHYDQRFSTGRMVWIDACLQALMSCDLLIKMNETLGGTDDVSDLKEERARLEKVINEKAWDEKSQFYYDLWEDDEKNFVKHIGAYWALLADIVPKKRLDGFVSHLKNEKEFARPVPVPSLSADHPDYDGSGGYWKGGVWSPTNYMVLSGLVKNGYYSLAYEIAEKYVDAVVKVFNESGTVWENYAPENARKGQPAKADFVGWTGLAPISVLFEFVLGVRADVPNNIITWDLNRTERHGITKYPFGADNEVDLLCKARLSAFDEPVITVTAKKPVTVLVRYGNKQKIIQATIK